MTKLWVVCPSIRFAPNQTNETPPGEYIENYSELTLEQSEASGHVTLHTLQRAAEALGCRLVYAVIPDRPLAETLRERAELVAARQLANVEQTMRLEDQAVQGKAATRELRRRLIEELLCHPARLWDEK